MLDREELISDLVVTYQNELESLSDEDLVAFWYERRKLRELTIEDLQKLIAQVEGMIG